MRKMKGQKTIRHKTKLGLPDLETGQDDRARQLAVARIARSFATQSMNLSLGIVPNRGSCATKSISKIDNWPGTINVRLAAVCRVAYEAADTGLLSPDLVAGIRRVKGAKKLRTRLGTAAPALLAIRVGRHSEFAPVLSVNGQT